MPAKFRRMTNTQRTRCCDAVSSSPARIRAMRLSSPQHEEPEVDRRCDYAQPDRGDAESGCDDERGSGFSSKTTARSRQPAPNRPEDDRTRHIGEDIEPEPQDPVAPADRPSSTPHEPNISPADRRRPDSVTPGSAFLCGWCGGRSLRSGYSTDDVGLHCHGNPGSERTGDDGNRLPPGCVHGKGGAQLHVSVSLGARSRNLGASAQEDLSRWTCRLGHQDGADRRVRSRFEGSAGDDRCRSECSGRPGRPSRPFGSGHPLWTLWSGRPSEAHGTLRTGCFGRRRRHRVGTDTQAGQADDESSNENRGDPPGALVVLLPLRRLWRRRPLERLDC